MRRTIFGLIVLFLLTACGAEEISTPTLSPVSTIAGLPLAVAEPPAHILIRNPSSLREQYIRIRGDYRSTPLLVCPNETHRSPATWQLLSEGLDIPAAGFDSELRELGYQGMPMVVEGRWLYWEGPVGCGRRPPVQQIWYLAVTEILSPNPLTAADVSEDEVAVAPVPTTEITPAPPVVTLEVEPTNTPGAIIPTATEQPTMAASATSTTAARAPTVMLSPSPTASLSATLSPTTTVESTATFTATATVVSTATVTGTATITQTPTASVTTSGSPSPTSVSTEAASPTATVVTSEAVIGYEDIVTGMLAPGSLERWDFVGSTGDEVTISVASDFDLDIGLELVAPDRSVLATRDEGGAGQPETISRFTINESGTYGVRIRSINSGSGYYALALSDSLSEAFLIYRATLDYGFSGTEDLPEGTDFLYAFIGVTDERITAAVVSESTSNMVLYLFSPSGVELEFVDQDETESRGAREELTNYSLPETGFFTIRIGDWDFQQARFSYFLTQN